MDEIKKIEERMGDGHWRQREDIKYLLFKIKKLEKEVTKLTLAKQDAEGQLDILRPEYGRLQERAKELVEGIGEVLDGTLPYLAEQKLKKLIEKEKNNG